MSEIAKRVIVAVVLIPIAFAIVLAGSYYFFATILLISILALKEFYQISQKKGYSPSIFLSLIFNLIILFNTYITVEYPNISFVSNNIILLILPTIIFFHQLFSKKTNIYENVGTTFAGLLYITLPLTLLLLLRLNTNIAGINNAYLILTIFCSIWICDSAAFFIGKKFGKRKLFESVSPKKTIAGAVGGFFATLLFFPIIAHNIMSDLPLLYACIIGAIIGVFGQIGDLIESKFKRDVKVKDSGQLIPGHGGILDRFDSIIFTTPIIYFFIALVY